MDKVWNIKKEGDINIIKHLSVALNVNMIIANLLAQRGITTYAEAQAFFRPKLSDLHDPFLMKDMDKAVERLERAIDNQEKVLIYGDYDVDGTTSVAMMYQFLRSRLKNLDYYIPDRYSEGYGISKTSILYAAEQSITLVIVLDCGIKAIEKIKMAKDLGIDFIICDQPQSGRHHSGKPMLFWIPNGLTAPIHTKNFRDVELGSNYFRLFPKKNNIPFSELTELLDLVVVSIASDIVPVTGENRVLAHFGLKKLNSSPSIGLKTIMNYSGLNTEEKSVSDIVFKIGPRLNASGRIEHGKKSVAILTATNEQEALLLGDEINSYNEIRKTLDRDITQEALEMIKRDPGHESRNATVLYNRDWHKGVVGIVASRLTEHFYRPTVVLNRIKWAGNRIGPFCTRFRLV